MLSSYRLDQQLTNKEPVPAARHWSHHTQRAPLGQDQPHHGWQRLGICRPPHGDRPRGRPSPQAVARLVHG
jgi:hypothetical protein